MRTYEEMMGNKNPKFKTGLCCSAKKDFKGIYNSWQNMKGRCLRKKHPKYYRYGGRGIKITPDWIDIRGFLAWAIESGWKPGLTLDRINNDGNYSPDNCRWVSLSENSRKKSTTKISLEQAKDILKRFEKGEQPAFLAKEYSVTHGTVWFIINKITHTAEGECSKRLKQRSCNFNIGC